MNNELREAAERLSTLSGMSQYMRDQAAVDAVKVAEAWLAEHLPDDGKIADRNWLLQQFGIFRAESDMFWISTDDFSICVELEHCKTISRGQVRKLLRVLQ